MDDHVVPNSPHDSMAQSNDLFGRYDLLFGVTELESYHTIDAVALLHGMLEKERDTYLRLYMQTRFEMKPDVALALTLKLYATDYANPNKNAADDNRDTLLEILSDARVVAPLMQTGFFHANLNPRSFMYVYGHNTRNGDFRDVSHVFFSILTNIY